MEKFKIQESVIFQTRHAKRVPKRTRSYFSFLALSFSGRISKRRQEKSEHCSNGISGEEGLATVFDTAPATPFKNQGVLSAISDIVAQKLSGIQKLQIKRLLLKVLFGAAYLGPLGHYFHMLLDKIFKGKKDTKTVAKKFWPVVGWVNHQYIPLQFRVIVQSVVACFWGIFLNLRARSMALTKAFFPIVFSGMWSCQPMSIAFAGL
ncbi:Peroxisomal membrane protein PMP22 [Sesamum angolense]|uniref:Peroxisomal membrane protein PMP22 n=1 Tax=Sesamum angolense TaxID=2727404 RepID=A0AAE2BVJ7_9LAMI|nr:Peroxisomal membrane protein PMP22 [Sesamum angolense]